MMKTIKEVESELYTHLTPFFYDRGFELKPALKQYRKTTESGFQNFIFSLSQSSEDFFLEVNFGVRLDAIEHIAQQFLDTLPAFQQEANTLIISIGKFNDNKYFRYRIQHAEDLNAIAAQIKEFVNREGLSFTHEFSTLKNVDVLLNRKPRRPCKYLYNQTHRCFKGLVAAKLIHSPNFIRLIDQYLSQLKSMRTKENLLASYTSMANYLTYYSEN